MVRNKKEEKILSEVLHIGLLSNVGTGFLIIYSHLCSEVFGLKIINHHISVPEYVL